MNLDLFLRVIENNPDDGKNIIQLLKNILTD